MHRFSSKRKDHITHTNIEWSDYSSAKVQHQWLRFHKQSFDWKVTREACRFRLRRELKIFDRFRCGHGSCKQQMYRWNFADSPIPRLLQFDGTNDVARVTWNSVSDSDSECQLRRFSGTYSDLKLATALRNYFSVDINKSGKEIET